MKLNSKIVDTVCPTPKDSTCKSIPAHLENADRRYGQQRFLALLDPIRLSINAGLSRIVIYEMHHAELGISYSQFTRYVARYIQPVQDLPESSVGHIAPMSTPTSTSLPVTKSSTVVIGQPRFNYDPTIPKERLI